MTTKSTTVLDSRAVERTLKRMSVEIVELNRGTDNLILVGIQRRGVQLADQLVRMIDAGEGVLVPQGSLDITLYRDDLQTVGPRPVVGPTYLPWDLDGKHIVIVDDVFSFGKDEFQEGWGAVSLAWIGAHFPSVQQVRQHRDTAVVWR